MLSRTQLHKIQSLSRSRSCNELFFRSWNPSMAYWLGFMFADGNVHKPKRGKRYNVSIQLKCTDYDHLQKFKHALGSTYHLGLYKTNMQTCCVMHAINNNTLAKDLINLGCVPNKSLILEWPHDLPEDCASHFVRGYFDGDGCISYVASLKAFRVDFCGSHCFISKLQSFVKAHVLDQHNARGYVAKCGSTSRLGYQGVTSSMKVLDWLYQNSDITTRMDRKYALYSQFREIADLNCSVKSRDAAVQQFRQSPEWKLFFQCRRADFCPQVYPVVNMNKNHQKIHQHDKNDDSLIREWECANDIRKETGFQSGSILNVCRGTNKSAYGYVWKFAP